MAAVITAKLTKTYIAEHIKPTGERKTYRDAECRGLILRVGATGKMSWAYDYRDAAGKRQTWTIGTLEQFDPGRARLAVDKVRGKDPAGEKREVRVEDAKAESRTVRKFVEGRYWTDCLIRAKSGSDTKNRILSAWKPILDDDMATLDIQKVVAHRSDRLTEEIAPQTLNRDRTALLALMNKAVEFRVIDKNPLDDPAFKPFGRDLIGDDKRVRWLGQRDEQEEIFDDQGNKLGERARFMQALNHPDTPAYLRRLCILALNTGMRRGEMFKLRWENVSIQRAELIVTAASSKGNKTRHIALNATAVGVLQELAAERDAAAREAKAAGEPVKLAPFVFVNADTDKPFVTLKKSWAVLIERAQLNDLTFHDQRHDFASRLVQAGVDLYQVRDLLGHSSITLTERYAHLAPHQKRAAVALLDAA
ncbi:MAG: site-specific integrase [Hydrogenophaga sp.]|uniref:site-specific integrase n=1 Tax=Hydrogenophaga sp. TaxID=1904254 RepID=UPI00261E1C76|nr:site-specific integrase [Hydrogenophaga sp.]MDM7943390.1 site-specific integrase [Hydrogenophaga sp.]